MEQPIPKGATTISMCYTLYHEIVLPEDLDITKVEDYDIKWGNLHLTMKDGTTLSIDGEEINMESVNLKRGHKNIAWKDNDYNDLS